MAREIEVAVAIGLSPNPGIHHCLQGTSALSEEARAWSGPETNSPIVVDVQDTPTDAYLAQLRHRLWIGDEGLDQAELLQLLGSHSLPPVRVPAVSQRLLEEFTGLAHVFGAPNDRLRGILSDSGRLPELIKTVHVVMATLLREPVVNRPVVASWTALMDYLKLTLGSSREEMARILFLDRKNQLIKDELHSRGTVSHVPLYPREIVKRVLEVGASAIILVHNHPSGDPSASAADREMTTTLADVLRLMDVTLHDHVIVGQGRCFSFRAHKLLVD